MPSAFVLLLVLGLPQGEAASVPTDVRGWPMPAQPPGAAAARAEMRQPAGASHAEVEFFVPQAEPEGQGALPAAPGGAAPVAAAPGVKPMPATALASPLRELWAWIGQPQELAALGGARAELALHVHDAAGHRVGTRHLTMECDLRASARDRIELDSGRKVYGRDGAAAFAQVDGVLWPSREREAREWLAVLGLLVRLPWALADPRYEVYPAEPVELDGRKLLRVRVEARPVEGTGLQEPSLAATERFELWLDPARKQIDELRYQLDGQSERCRVQLLEWQALPTGLRVPVRRHFVGPEGQLRMELEIVRMDCQRPVDLERFRPAS